MTLLNALVVSSIFAAGAYLLLQRELVRTVLGIALISNSATLFIIASGLRRGGPPIYPLGERVADPLVQSLALAALVIGFGVTALLLALVVRIFAAGGTLDVERIAYGERQRSEAAEHDSRREHDRDLEPVLEALPLDEPEDEQDKSVSIAMTKGRTP